MKINWSQLETKNEEGMIETLAICKTMLPQKEERFLTPTSLVIKHFMRVEYQRVKKVYFIFIMALLIILLTPLSSIENIILLYYMLLGIYFLYQLYEFRNNAMEELLRTLCINEVTVFYFKMCGFLALHSISFVSFILIGMLKTNMDIVTIIQLAIIPLFITQGIMLFIIHRIHSFQLALAVYVIIFFILCSNLYTSFFMYISVYQLTDVEGIMLSFTAILLFIFAVLYYQRYSRKESVYEIRN